MVDEHFFEIPPIIVTEDDVSNALGPVVFRHLTGNQQTTRRNPEMSNPLAETMERVDAIEKHLGIGRHATVTKEESPIDFASDAAREKAAEAKLTAADFKGVKPTGTTGYTVADVEAIAKARDSKTS